MAFTPVHHTSYPFISPSKFTNSLAGKIVLVTGASKGIGRATALAFAATGASVAAVARGKDELETLVSEIKEKYKVAAVGIVADLLVESATSIFRKVQEALGGEVDILVNNAGILRCHPFAEEKTLEKWWTVMEMNTRVPLSITLAFLQQENPKMKERTMITLSSATASGPLANFSAYAASKAALQKALETITYEATTPFPFNNYIIHPGFINTAALDPKTREPFCETDGMTAFWDFLLQYAVDDLSLGVDTVVALAVLGGGSGGEVGGEGSVRKVLNGRFFNSNWDLEAVIAGEVGGGIVEEDLLKLRFSGV